MVRSKCFVLNEIKKMKVIQLNPTLSTLEKEKIEKTIGKKVRKAKIGQRLAIWEAFCIESRDGHVYFVSKKIGENYLIIIGRTGESEFTKIIDLEEDIESG